MALVNEHFLKLPGIYLFSDIAKKINTFRITHPKQDIIRLGIGDVTQPLPKACIEAMHKAVEELADKDTFRGYGPEQGYDFLIEAIIKNDFAPRDGAKSDTGNIGDILRHDNSVGVTDPIYPVYIDSNVMCGRAGVLEEETGKWSNVTYMPCTSENNFIPEIPDKRIDIVYLCYPLLMRHIFRMRMSPTLFMKSREPRSAPLSSVVFRRRQDSPECVADTL